MAQETRQAKTKANRRTTPVVEDEGVARSNGSRHAEGPPSYALQLILSIKDSLPPSQARVAEVIVQRPFEIIEWTAAQLAAVAGTSDATVVRTCKSLSFEGLDQLRLNLARDLGWSAQEPPIVSSDASKIFHELFTAARDALPNMLRPVDPTTLQQLVDTLVTAKSVLTVASGADSATLAAELAFGLTMLGRPATHCPDQLVQHLTARNLGPGDLCVVVAQGGSSRITMDVAKAAHEAGALVAAFGSHVRSRLEDVVDLSVCLDRIGYFMDPADAINHVGLGLGIRALVLAVQAQLGERADRSLRTNLDVMSSHHHLARHRS